MFLVGLGGTPRWVKYVWRNRGYPPPPFTEIIRQTVFEDFMVDWVYKRGMTLLPITVSPLKNITSSK